MISDDARRGQMKSVEVNWWVGEEFECVLRGWMIGWNTD